MDLPIPTVSDAPVSVIGPQYCASFPLQLQISRNVQSTCSDGSFVVTDVNGSLIFKVQEKEYSMHGRRVLVDGAGNPIVTIRKKTISAYKRWKVFMGESDEKSDLIFTVRQSAMFREKTKLHVFLPENKEEDVCDFKIEKSQSQELLLVYHGESSRVLAAMHKKNTTPSASTSEDNYALKIRRNTDYAFIITLIVIYNECNEKKGENGRHDSWLLPLGEFGLELLMEIGISVVLGG